MKRIAINKYFFLDEYVTPEFYRKWGRKCIWWLRPELIAVDLFIRERYGIPIIMNNWAIGGAREQSGLRYPEAEIGAGDSQHKFGAASDKTFVGKDADFYDEVREDIEMNFKTLFKPLGLTTIEANTKTWLHTDSRNIPNQKELFIVPYY